MHRDVPALQSDPASPAWIVERIHGLAADADRINLAPPRREEERR